MRRLQALGLIDGPSVAAVEALWWYGRLIANTDMHLANLSFHVDHTLRLAPTYDMLLMAYAPLVGGEVPPRNFIPEYPQPQQRDTWLSACATAVTFWRTAAADTRISAAFREICRNHGERLCALAEGV